MNKNQTPLTSLLLVTLFFTFSPAGAQEPDERTTRQAGAVSQRIYDRLQDVQAAIDSESYAVALQQIEKLGAGDLSHYEQTKVLQYKAYIQHNIGDSAAALQTYSALLRIPELEPATYRQTLYIVAQLNMVLENFAAAIANLEEWFGLEPGPAPETYILYAQALYQENRHAMMVEPIETAINVAKDRGVPIREDWYALLGFAFFQQENYAKVRDVYKILLAEWPDKRYWLTLAGTYTELGEQDKVYAIYDALRAQGLLETEAELVTMAQLYLQHEVPYKAGALLRAEMDAGRISQTAANYRLMSQAWSLAQETERAIPALHEAARRSDDGELDVRLANAYLNLLRYEECVVAVQAGLAKGELRKPADAHITLGMCQFNLRNYDGAAAAFREARKTSQNLRIAEQWIDVVNQEVARAEQIAIAETAARKQIEQLAARRAEQNDRR